MTLPAFGVGAILALLVLVIAVVLLVISQISLPVGLMLAALALARLLP